MTLELDEETLFSEERCFAIDLEIAFEERTCLGTLLISPAFRNKWIEHFAHNQSEYFSQKIAHQTELLLGLKIGETTLLQSQWEEFEKGDCLLLDKASYHPKKNKNKASMNLNGIPLFQVAIQDNQIEILDYTLTQEEPMELDDNDLPYSEADEEITSLKDVPVTVTIELTRLKMSLDRLMNLSPGNLLDLSLSPEQGVSLCIQGKKVASGELVYLGEVLAVRILKI
jgi:flagellar motor switch protein FliN/FliY